MHTDLILERLYRIPRRRQRRRNYLGRAQRWLVDWVSQHNWKISCGAVGFAVWVMTHVYFYNRLTVLEFDVKAAWAQVEAAQQKRNHVQRNLTQLLRYYAKYEKTVMTDLTKLRTESDEEGSPASNAQSASELLMRLKAVAEQYPNLHLNNSVQQLTGVVVNSEGEIAQYIMAYNNAVNMYTTVLSQFPGNLFGKTMGFGSYDFYEPEDRRILQYKEMQP